MGIKKARMLRNMTQNDVAKKLGVTRSSVAMWESGGVMPRAEMLLKLAKLFGCSVDELLRE